MGASLRSLMAQHFERLEGAQGGVGPIPTPVPTWTPTPQAPQVEQDPIKRAILGATATGQLDYIEAALRRAPPGANMPDWKLRGYLAQIAQRRISLAARTTAGQPKITPPFGATSNAIAAGKTSVLGGWLKNLLGTAGKSVLSVVEQAQTNQDNTGINDLLAGLGDAGRSWLPGEYELNLEELELSKRAQDWTEKAQIAQLLESVASVEQAESESRRSSLLTAAQDLWTAAQEAAPPGMTTYPGYEEGGQADVLSRIAGNKVPSELSADITRRPVSFGVLPAYDTEALREAIRKTGIPGFREGGVTLAGMAEGGTSLADWSAKMTPEEQVMWRKIAAQLAAKGQTGADITAAGKAGAAPANTVDSILGRALYESWLDRELEQARLQGVEIPSVRTAIGQALGYFSPDLFNAQTQGELAAALSSGGTPTLEMRDLLASTAANPRDIIKMAFLSRGMGLPESMSNVAAVNVGSVGGGGGTAGGVTAASATPAASAIHALLNPTANPVGSINPNTGNIIGGYSKYGMTAAKKKKRTAASSLLGKINTGTATAAERARFGAGMTPLRSAAGRAVSGPVISRVGEAGEEYALLPPGAVVAPKPKGQKPSIDNAVRAIAGQVVRSMQTGGITLNPDMLKAPGLAAFMGGGGQKLSQLVKYPTLFKPFGEGTEAPNWLNPGTSLAYAHGTPSERSMMEALTSAFGIAPEDALEIGRRVIAGYGKPVTGQATYRPYWSWGS